MLSVGRLAPLHTCFANVLMITNRHLQASLSVLQRRFSRLLCVELNRTASQPLPSTLHALLSPVLLTVEQSEVRSRLEEAVLLLVALPSVATRRELTTKAWELDQVGGGRCMTRCTSPLPAAAAAPHLIVMWYAGICW
jgi:hypothetical protein